jgi:hypothetical protein
MLQPEPVSAPARRVRIKFDGAFPRHALTHHVSRHDVERVLRWPRWVAELTEGAEIRPSESIIAWVATPPMPNPRDPSVLLVVTRDRKNDRRVHDAWRLYLSDLNLGRARSARDVLAAFLDRYGLDVQLGIESRRLFLPCRLPMGPTGNASMRIAGAESCGGVHPLEVFRLVPERAEIEVGIAFAVNESALRADLARHVRPGPGR